MRPRDPFAVGHIPLRPGFIVYRYLPAGFAGTVGKYATSAEAEAAVAQAPEGERRRAYPTNELD